jgi:tryptophanase
MSSLTILGDTSGSVVLAAPAVAGSTTLTLPATTGTLSINGPAVYATATGTQNISNNTWTKIQFNTETFDTNNNFDSTTNYRFTPTVAGYYFVSVSYDSGASSGITAIQAAVYKNGTQYGTQASQWNLANAGTNGYVNALVYCNGSTDYIEGYQYTTTSSQGRINGNVFYAYMARGA